MKRGLDFNPVFLTERFVIGLCYYDFLSLNSSLISAAAGDEKRKAREPFQSVNGMEWN